MRLVTFDPATATDRSWAELHALACAHLTAVAPDEPLPTEAELRRDFGPTSATVRLWNKALRSESGELVGFARLTVREGEDTGYLHALSIAADHRRAGHGRRLLAYAIDEARSAGCRNLIGWTAGPDGAAFLESVGARTTGRYRRALLRLPLTSPAPPLADGYRLRTWDGPAPDALIDSYAVAREAINDAPRDADEAPSRYTAERIREMEHRLAERGQHLRVTVALDCDDQVMGFTGLYVSPEPGSLVSTADAAVLAAHRGRGLAGALKHESLRLLADARPDVTEVCTGNDTRNGPMIAVNDRVGFVETSTWTQAILDL
ncbi:N-acetyltransferase [Longispora fulva]|uniref:GNAT superfamily N-acetyltransferase n=1 Tax=Longispora fulva TaxID=619741 RepID=A0A8J7GDB0_9ACTN|nr:GNAT family N-acetyltransferase [Longispora fulva]MBG6138438.1 GNAT superfamily N-acetyltransferase [Longispora fulva]GIG63286.1 N-acetyltransferase [Longispora fulva]